MVSSEASPWAKTGGLADVAGALPGALACLGHSVATVIPRYMNARNAPAKRVISSLWIQLGARVYDVSIWELGVRITRRSISWISPRSSIAPVSMASQRGEYPDNHIRDLQCSRKPLLRFRGACFGRDVIHCHDLEGLPRVLAYLNDPQNCGSNVPRQSELFCLIHNLGCSGDFRARRHSAKSDCWRSSIPTQGMEIFGKINLAQSGDRVRRSTQYR